MVEINLLISLSGVVGAGISAYLGVRVALAELRGEIKRLDLGLQDLVSRTERLEAPFFERRAVTERR
jgi:hypothetical protein